MLDPGRRRTTSAHQMNQSDEINEPVVVAGRLSCDSYDSYEIRDYGNRVRKSAEYYAKFRQSWSGPLVVADDYEEEEEGGEFGFSTPPVWGPTSASASPHHYRNLSPASKAQAIVRGQRELMEMVSKMPESCYELSLKDLVEQQQPIVEEKEKQEQEQESEKGVKKKINKKNGSVRRNNNDGFLLKMVFPVAFGTKKKNNNNKSQLGSYSFKVAPRPPVVEGSDNKEWWKKRIEQSESEISGSRSSSSTNNGSGKSSVTSRSLSRNSSRHETGGCFSFLFRPQQEKQKCAINLHSKPKF